MANEDHGDGAFTGEEVLETPDFVFFWKPPAVFGQWTPSPFTVDGVAYQCAEQFMMAEKARLFGDEETRKKMLGTDDPRAHKRLGRQVRGFEDAVWVAHRYDIVVAGNLAKFGQNQSMREVLLRTGTKILAEASPLDRIWGIGLRADDPRALERSQWRGENLLGEALMVVRTRLRGE